MRLAPKRTSFSSKQPKIWCKLRFYAKRMHFPTFTTHPFFHQNKPSRESIICGRVGSWWITRALIMLKFLLKTRQKYLRCIYAHGQRQGKHVRLRPPARAVAGHAAHGQWRRNYSAIPDIYIQCISIYQTLNKA